MPTGAYEGTVFAVQDDKLVGTIPNAALGGGIVYCSIDRTVSATATGLTLASIHKVGKLPKGAVVLYSIVYPIATATFDAPDATSGATTGTLGVAANTALGITADPDLFGDVSTLASTTPQVVIPKPDGSVYSNRLKPLTTAVDVIFTSASIDWTDAEGFVVMMFYTIAGAT